MRFRFHPEALEEYHKAALYYEAKQPGLGERFMSSVEYAVDSILAAPEMWPSLEGEVRRRLTRVFPYAVLYSVDNDVLLILAVMHCHQHPNYWKSRLR